VTSEPCLCGDPTCQRCFPCAGCDDPFCGCQDDPKLTRPAEPGVEYAAFLARKSQLDADGGFAPVWMPAFLFDFQRALVEWALRRGRAAIFADTGLGKTVMELVFGENVVRHTKGRVLVLTPLAVGAQMEREAQRFGIAARRSADGTVHDGITITNYERLHYFKPDDFVGVIADESSILKNFDGATKAAVTEFMRKIRYRLLATATAAPNDYVELGTSSEALGYLGHVDMLTRFFVNQNNTVDTKGHWKGHAAPRAYEAKHWRFKGHAEEPFWKWVCSWARAIRRPSDLGFDDAKFTLPPLRTFTHYVKIEAREAKAMGTLFPMEAITLDEQRAAKRASLGKRVRKIVELVEGEPAEPWLVWCELNDESKEIARAIPGAVEVSGSDTPERKEAVALWFAGLHSEPCECPADGPCVCRKLTDRRRKVLVSKSSIFGFGLNFQQCARTAFVSVSHCFDAETEVLTQDGWKTFDKVSTSDLVGTVNRESLAMEWQHPTEVIWSRYEGEMIHFGGTHNFDLVVTPNHDLFAKRCTVRYPSSPGSWEFVEAQSVRDRYRRQEYRMLSAPKQWRGAAPEWFDVPVPDDMRVNARTNIVRRIPAEDMMRLAGWYVSEGHCRPLDSEHGGRIVICQTDAHPDHRAEIVALLKSLGLAVIDATKDITVHSKQLATFLVDNFGRMSRGVRLPRWVKDLDARLLTILRDTMLKGDGCHADGVAWFYRTVSRQLADDFQEVCLKTGIRASVRHRHVTGACGESECYDVSLARQHTEPSISAAPAAVPYSGYVGCVSVPNRTVIVRRNGIPVVSGNSYERQYQAIRRFWRFGQTREVHVHVIAADTESAVVDSLERKANNADVMLSRLVQFMRDSMAVQRVDHGGQRVETPPWM